MALSQTLHRTSTNWKQAAVLFLVAFFIRAPFFFRDFVDHDESTFILMGQSIVDGHLPYDHLWDLKPPLLFYLFAAVEWLFPKSFIAIRFFGVLVVFGSALLLAAIARRNNIRNGFFAALFYIMLSSEFGPLQGVMSEHLAVFFLLLGLYLFQQHLLLVALAAGFSFGCALLCKLSYGYAVVAFVAAYGLFHRQKLFGSPGIKAVLFGIGVLLPFGLMLLPYMLQQKTGLFFDSVFLAPLQYEQATQKGLWQRLLATWWVVVPSLVLCYAALRKASHQTKETVWLLIALLLGTVYVYLSSGKVNGHYLVQAYPLLLLLGATLIKRTYRVKTPFIALFVLLTSAESLIEYYRLAVSYSKTSSPYYRPGFTIVRELQHRKLDTASTFFAHYHIAYWMLGKYPLTKSTTHPSNISRDYLFKYYGVTNTSLGELRYILDSLRPTVVVSRAEYLPFYPADAPANLYFRQVLEKDFKPIVQNGAERIFVWQRTAADSVNGN